MGAGNAMGKEISDVAVIVKMIRVMLLVPALLFISLSVVKRGKTASGERKTQIAIPWFAIGFLMVIGFNSLGLLPLVVVDFINQVDTFLLTMAMTALGAETSIEKFKKAGAKPFVLALILYGWLLGGSYVLIKYVLPGWV